MLSRWVPFLRPRFRPKETRFKHSLIRKVLVVLLIISVIPLILIGTLNFLRTRDILGRQVSGQLESIVNHEVEQINQYIDLRSLIIERMVTEQDFQDSLFAILNTAPDTGDYQWATAMIFHSYRINAQLGMKNIFDQIFLMRPDGTLILASNDIWFRENFGEGAVQHPLLRELNGTNRAVFAYGPVPGYKDTMPLFIARSFVDEQGVPTATLIAISNTDLTYLTLQDSSSFLPEANAYFFTPDASLIGVTENYQLMRMPDDPGVSAAIKPIIGPDVTQLQFGSKSHDNTQIIGNAKWLPKYNIGILLTVSEWAIYQNNNPFDPFNLALLSISLLISGVLIYYGGTQLVNPLVKMAHAADSFSKGKWDERVVLDRDDEVGSLADSFNHMADELSELYQSLEGAVDRRTSQLRIASEVAQLATSTTKISDALGRTAELIADRFGFYHVAIYLFDEPGQNLVLKEASGMAGAQVLARGDQVALEDNTLISWVAANNQSKIVFDVTGDPLFRADELLPDTLSETGIPITIGTEVLGVLDIQSTIANAFDDETVAVFQTFANQISSTLQATRLLESTQISYQETILLYTCARQVIQAHQEADIVQAVAETFTQLPFIGSILSVEGENFKILALADMKTGRVEKSLQSLNIPTGRMVDLLTEKRVVFLEDITQPSEFDNMVSFLLRRGCKTAALISVLESGRLSKVIVLGTYEQNQITQNSLPPYMNLADIMGAALEKFRVLNTLQKRLAELQILSSFSQAISAETDLTHLYRVLHEQVIQTLGPDLEFAIAIYNQQENLIEWPYFYEEGQVKTIAPTKLGEGLTSILIQSKKPLLLMNEKAAQSMGMIVVGKPPKSWMGIPLIFAGEAVGAMLVQDLAHENVFDQDDLNLFMTLAPQIANNVRNTQLYTETQRALRAYDQERFLFNTLLDSIPEGISIKDTNGRYIRASESIAQIFHMNAGEIVGKTDYDLLDRETAERVFREEQKVMNIGKPEIGLIQHTVQQDGTETWTHTSRLPIRTVSGEPYGLLLIQREITDLKRTEALAQRRAEQVLTAAEIARDATGTLELTTLLQKSVNLVRDRFGFYHASIFLLDVTGENALLRESTGTAGEKMMQAGHRLAVGSKSIVGQVTEKGEALIVNDVSVDPTHLPNPLLPETRSELAIPLKVGERILGALDVQSTQQNAFHAEDISVLQILADQLAVSVVNSELFAKAQELLGKHRLLRQISIAASTSTDLEDAMGKVVSGLRTAMVGDRIAIFMLNEEGMLQVQASAGYEGAELQSMRIEPGQGICGKAVLEKRPIRIDDVLNDPDYIRFDSDVRSELAIPILFSESLIGVLNLESTLSHAFDENDQEILGALGNNLGGVIANIRLVNQVRKQVLREHQLFEVTSRIRYSVDMDTILETSVKEIARALGARRASIRITGSGQELSDLLPGELPTDSYHQSTGSTGSNGSNGSNGTNGKGTQDNPGNGRMNR